MRERRERYRRRGWIWLPNLRVMTRTFETDVRALTTDVGVVDPATVVRVSTLTAVVSGQRHLHALLPSTLDEVAYWDISSF